MPPFPLAVLLLSLASPGVSAQGVPAPPGQEQTRSAEYYFVIGRHLEGEGKIDEAIAAHRQAISIDPNSAELRAELAGLFARQDRPQEAIETAEAALKIDAANREANRILGSVYAALSEQKRPLRPGDDPETYAQKALAALTKARREGIFDVNLELTLGRLYLQAGRYPAAVASLRRVVDDQPGYSDGAMMLAAAQEGAGDEAGAIRTLEAAVLENPSFYRAHIRLAELYEEGRRYRDAERSYAAAQKLVGSRADFSTQRASALLNAGDASAARTLLESAIAAKTEKPDAGLLFLLAQADRRLRDSAAASKTAERLKAEYPDDLRAVYLDAQLLLDAGRTSEAVAAFEAVMKRAPRGAAFVYEYADALEKAGRVADAERALRGLLKDDPMDANALNSLGYMFAERGERLDEAVELIQRALQIDPANPSYLDSLGWAYFKQGRLEAAEPPLVEAAAKSESSSAIQDHVGDLRMRQQRYAEAIEAWRRALAGDGVAVERAAIERKIREARARLGK